MAKSAAIRSPHCLLQTRKRFLIHCIYFELLALFEILSFQRPSDYVNQVFELSDSKIYTVVHHFSQSFEILRRNVKKKDLWARDICRPIKLVSFISTHYQNVALVYHHNFAFADLFIEHFK